MEEKLQELDGKLRTLKFTLGKSEQEIETRNLDVITRHEASIKGKIEASHALKDDIIELKFGLEQSEEQVQEWLVDIEGILKTADEKLVDLKRIKENIAKENQAVELAESVRQERAIEDQKHEQKMSHKRELYEQQLKFQKVLATGQQNQVKKAASTKLPKLSITQFDGKCANWPPFWNKFVAEIDGADLSPVTKFTYLKEFVKPKVRADIDGLPLTVEGYERAKNILKGEYGKPSEIVNAYVLGLVCSPFLLGGVVVRHLESWEEREPELVAEIRRSLYVDDLLSGKPTVAEAKKLKEGAIEIFQDAQFTLHKWHSNDPELESEQSSVETENTFAKQQLGAPTDPESSLLGLSSNKEADEFSVVVPEMKPNVTKRELLSNLASIYDPLGYVTPVTLKGKTI